MKAPIHRLLYHTLPLEGYLRVVSRMFFLWQRLGIGRYAPATEYVYHLPQLVHEGDTCIDIGANLGYYARTISRLAGPAGRVFAVEPVAPIRKVLSRNLRRCANIEILPYALGTESRPVVMGNDSARETGYFGTGQNFVNDSGRPAGTVFTATMRRGSELFAALAGDAAAPRTLPPHGAHRDGRREPSADHRPLHRNGLCGLHAQGGARGAADARHDQRHHLQTCALTSYPRFRTC